MGMEVDLRKVPQSGLTRNDFILFSESQSRFVVTIDPSKKKMFESLLEDVVYGEIGAVSKDENFHWVGLNGKKIIEANINDLREAWQKPLRF
jgi:phosphoribosylformylglycinamidine synthase